MSAGGAVFALTVLALGLPALGAAQGLGDVAARAREDREKQKDEGKSTESRSFSNDDLEGLSEKTNEDSEGTVSTPGGAPAPSAGGRAAGRTRTPEQMRQAREGPLEDAVARNQARVQALEASVEELQQHLARQGVETVGPVQGDGQDPVVEVGEEGFVVHGRHGTEGGAQRGRCATSRAPRELPRAVSRTRAPRAPLRRAGVPRLPALRRPFPRPPAVALRCLWLRSPRALQAHSARFLPQLRRPPHGRFGREATEALAKLRFAATPPRTCSPTSCPRFRSAGGCSRSVSGAQTTRRSRAMCFEPSSERSSPSFGSVHAGVTSAAKGHLGKDGAVRLTYRHEALLQ